MKYQIKDIPNFPGYRIDTNGDVWSCWARESLNGPTGKRNGSRVYLGKDWAKLSLVLGAQGYYVVCLHKNGKQQNKRVHRLVAEAFCLNPDHKPYALHKDDNPINNDPRNLYWGTSKENAEDRMRNGTSYKGEHNVKAKLNKFQVQRMRLLKEITPEISMKALGTLFGIKSAQTAKIIRRASWKHI